RKRNRGHKHVWPRSECLSPQPSRVAELVTVRILDYRDGSVTPELDRPFRLRARLRDRRCRRRRTDHLCRIAEEYVARRIAATGFEPAVHQPDGMTQRHATPDQRVIEKTLLPAVVFHRRRRCA